MKAADLQTIIYKWNTEMFSHLEKRLGISPVLTTNDGPRIYHLPEGMPCHCGHATEIDAFPDQLREIASGNSLAVGAVLDETTKTSDICLPVVVAVGINYGQFGTSAPRCILKPDWDKTEMWRRLGLVLQRLDEECLDEQVQKRFGDKFSELDKELNKPFHLVAVNYFPWLTNDAWGDIGLNAIAESLVLRCWGFDHPEAHIADLIAMISENDRGTEGFVGKIPLVIFHGANNAVPYLALDTIRRAGLWGTGLFTNNIFSDNLAWASSPHNAVILLPSTPLLLKRTNTNEVDNS